jgi:hypothetical protein
MTKKIINVLVGTPVKTRNTVRIDGTIGLNITSPRDMISSLQKMEIDYGAEYSNLRFEERNDCGCYSTCSCPPNYYLSGDRMETDLEYQYRVEDEAARDEKRRTRDIAELARLEKLYKKN